jgi:uncharacterized membrane protein YeiB
LERERILALDALRGLAVLGILTMNVHGFAQTFANLQKSSPCSAEPGRHFAPGSIAMMVRLSALSGRL